MMGGVLEDALPVAARTRTSVTSVAADHRGMSVRDTAEFDAFARACLPGLLRFGRALTGRDDAAADLVQDALERALLHWDTVEDRDHPERTSAGSW